MNLSFSQKLRIAILVSVVAISKHLVILNEEILVALSFLLFLIFSTKTFSESVKSALEARTVATHNELQNYLQVKLNSNKENSNYHKQFLKTKMALDQISNLLTNELKNSSSNASNQLKTLCLEQTRNRINTLITINSNFSTSLQKAIISNFHSLLNK